MHGITIGIPAHNARKTLERALKSALRQTPAVPFEIVVVDDGSDDTTANIALHYELMHPNTVRLIRTPNRGVAAARNTIVSEARYSLLTWLDADDFYYPDKLTYQYEAYMMRCMVERILPNDPRVIVFCAFDLNGSIYSYRPFLPAPIKHILSGDFRAYLWASLAATQAYRQTGPFNEKLHRMEDTDWLLRFLLSGERRIIITGEVPLMRYHFSTARDGRQVEDSLKYMVATYGGLMREHEIYEEYVPRRFIEISNFYHANKKWDDMWRCRAMAAALDPARYEDFLAQEISRISDAHHRAHVISLVKATKSAALQA